MILEILQKFHELIRGYEIQKFRMLGNAYEIVLQIHLIEGATLYVRDYLFTDGSRKYSFHWQDSQQQCKVRWDNAPHYQNTNTFPFHKHVGVDEMVKDSEVMNLEKVLEYINQYFKNGAIR